MQRSQLIRQSWFWGKDKFMEIAKTLNKNSERNMGIEFLRIVAMFMIVVHHLLFMVVF